MAIHWSLPLLENLLPDGLRHRLKEIQADPSYDPPDDEVLKIYNGLNGELLTELHMPKVMRVSRRKTRAFLCQGIEVHVRSPLFLVFS